MTEAMVPVPYIVTRTKRESADVWSLTSVPVNGSAPAFRPGQFHMLYAFGLGEVPVSISGDPSRHDGFTHTIRAVGKVTSGLTSLRRGASFGARGPFGQAWPVRDARGHDVLLVAGGIGLAPLRPVIYAITHDRDAYGRVVLLYGARSPEDQLFMSELARWQERHRIDVIDTVDRAAPDWQGHTGVVTPFIATAPIDPKRTYAMLCGPEVMMRFAIAELKSRGFGPEHVFVSLERNMKCAVGWCGHCQLGTTVICRDGPVFSLADVAPLLTRREL